MSLPRAWLDNLYAFANKPDQNLGRYEVGQSLCRITNGSAEKVFNEFFRIDLRCNEGLDRTFVDLGCGRGMVLAAALVYAPRLKRAIGWDLDAREIAWARQHVSPAANETEGALTQAKLRFEVADASAFCAARDIHRGFACSSPAGYPDALYPHESVWIYAFWFDWGPEVRRTIATHLFLEDGAYWSVFACSDGPDRKDLFNLIANGDERVYAQLHERFKKVSKVEVSLSGSGRRHTINFYVKK